MAVIQDILFNRTISVSVALPTKGSLVRAGDPVITFKDIRIKFEVTQTLNKEPNIAEINLYNLTAEQRAYFSEKGVKVSVSAGYKDNIDTIFTGDLKHSRSFKEGADWITSLECRDGHRTYAHSSARKSFRGGVRVKNVIDFLIKQLELETSAGTKKVLAALKAEYNNSKTLVGKSADLLDKVLRDHGMEWSIQNGRLQILKFGDAEEATPLIFLNKDTGLIGSPEEGAPDNKKGPVSYTLTSLLQSNLFPGKLVEVRSIIINDVIRVKKAVHTGDNFGNDWYSILEGTLWRT